MHYITDDFCGSIAAIFTLWVVAAYRFAPGLSITSDWRFAVNVSTLAALVIAGSALRVDVPLGTINTILIVVQLGAGIALHMLLKGPRSRQMAIHDTPLTVLTAVSMATLLGHIAVALVARSLA